MCLHIHSQHFNSCYNNRHGQNIQKNTEKAATIDRLLQKRIWRHYCSFPSPINTRHRQLDCQISRLNAHGTLYNISSAGGSNLEGSGSKESQEPRHSQCGGPHQPLATLGPRLHSMGKNGDINGGKKWGTVLQRSECHARQFISFHFTLLYFTYFIL